MTKLVLHRNTAQGLQAFVQGNNHALLIVGASGSGRSSLAQALATRLLDIADEKLDQHPYVRILRPEAGKTFGIEDVREIEHFLQLKVPGAAATNRIVIIEEAHELGTEAQNALLKTLEEPPAGSRLILTSISTLALLPTITSRTQILHALAPPKNDLESYFLEEGFQQTEIERAYQISGGLPGLMKALLSQADHPLLPAIEKARELLQQTTFERLNQVDELAKNRQLTDDVLFVLQHMAELGLQAANGKAAKRWQTVLKASYEAAEALSASGQTKLVLTNFMLGF
ncbi:MAG TPA: AAA family ATPase [Candidatus Saccharimonadales bacterium]|nr:AAA family ATPase [Candidatus Saccharimonadales bacterium]